MHCTGRLHHGGLTGHNELFGTNNNYYYKDFGYSIRPSDVSKKVCWAALITLILTKTFKHKQSGQKSKLCYYAFSLRLSVLFPCPFNCLWQNDATTITCITDRCAAYSVFINKKQKILKKKKTDETIPSVDGGKGTSHQPFNHARVSKSGIKHIVIKIHNIPYSQLYN